MIPLATPAPSAPVPAAVRPTYPAVAALKPRDGVEVGSLDGYIASHRGAPLRALRAAYARRRAAVCEIRGLTVARFDAVVGERVAVWLACRGLTGRHWAVALAYSHAANLALASALELPTVLWGGHGRPRGANPRALRDAAYSALFRAGRAQL